MTAALKRAAAGSDEEVTRRPRGDGYRRSPPTRSPVAPLFRQGSTAVTVGTAILGYTIQPDRRGAFFAGLRLSSIGKLITGRHNGPCDTDDGGAYLLAAMPHLVALATSKGRSVDAKAWARDRVPVNAATTDDEFFAQIEADFLDRARRGKGRLTADGIAKLLNVTADEVARYRLRTFGAIDRPKRTRTKDRKAADRDYQRRKRAAAGAKSREQSLAALKPWEAAGVSRATWYRQRETVSSAPK
jgi:hypothetical protein